MTLIATMLRYGCRLLPACDEGWAPHRPVQGCMVHWCPSLLRRHRIIPTHTLTPAAAAAATRARWPPPPPPPNLFPRPPRPCSLPRPAPLPAPRAAFLKVPRPRRHHLLKQPRALLALVMRALINHMELPATVSDAAAGLRPRTVSARSPSISAAYSARDRVIKCDPDLDQCTARPHTVHEHVVRWTLGRVREGGTRWRRQQGSHPPVAHLAVRPTHHTRIMHCRDRGEGVEGSHGAASGRWFNGWCAGQGDDVCRVPHLPCHGSQNAAGLRG